MSTLALLLALTLGHPPHWMPSEDELCRTPPPPPRWVCEDDPLCWCSWAYDPAQGCWVLTDLTCADGRGEGGR